MKQNTSVLITIRFTGIILLVLVFLFTDVGATLQADAARVSVSQAAISNYLVLQQDPDLSDEEKIKTVLNTYFILRYEGQKQVEAQDFSILLVDDTMAWVQQEEDKREIELYIASLFGLSYQDYKFTLDYDMIDITGDDAKVSLRQSHQVSYQFDASRVSGLSGLVHKFTLQRKNETWLIYRDEYEDEYTRLLDTTPKDKICNKSMRTT